MTLCVLAVMVAVGQAIRGQSPITDEWLKSNADLLRQELSSHRFAFIVGPHHSGSCSRLFLPDREEPLFSKRSCPRIPISLRIMTPDTSKTKVSGMPIDPTDGSGQHLQTVYDAAYKHGGKWKYGFYEGSHITETSPLLTPDNLLRL